MEKGTFHKIKKNSNAIFPALSYTRHLQEAFSSARSLIHLRRYFSLACFWPLARIQWPLCWLQSNFFLTYILVSCKVSLRYSCEVTSGHSLKRDSNIITFFPRSRNGKLKKYIFFFSDAVCYHTIRYRKTTMHTI